MSAFCEPVRSTSKPAASIGRLNAPSADTASTTLMTRSRPAVILAISSTGWRTPVDDSFACEKTAVILSSASSARSTAAGSTARPHSTSSDTKSRPCALQMFRQRSPNLPPTTHSALSPRFMVLTTAASIASVPEPESMRTGCLV